MKSKPISIVAFETKESIVKHINSLNVSPTILEPIIYDIFMQVQSAHKEELARDMEAYKENATNDKGD